MRIKIVCHELIVMSRVAGDIQYSQVGGGTPAVASLFCFFVMARFLEKWLSLTQD